MPLARKCIRGCPFKAVGASRLRGGWEKRKKWKREKKRQFGSRGWCSLSISSVLFVCVLLCTSSIFVYSSWHAISRTLAGQYSLLGSLATR